MTFICIEHFIQYSQVFKYKKRTVVSIQRNVIEKF